MTAAHCIDPEKDTYWVHIGDHDKRTSDEAQSEWVHVAQIIVHEGYNERGMANDIALLQLSNPLQFRHNVGQVCMPVREGRSRNTFENQPVTASGWGRTRTNSHHGSAVLMKADLNVLSNSRCRQSSQFQILESSICTYNRGKQPCNGDSGSSIDWQDSNGNYKAVGIVSHGEKDCHSTEPTVYARVTAYMDWIRQKTGETFCEV
jgi:chymotrypsin